MLTGSNPCSCGDISPVRLSSAALSRLSPAQWQAHLRLRSAWTPAELLELLRRGATLPDALTCRCLLLAASPDLRRDLAAAVCSGSARQGPHLSRLFRLILDTHQGGSELAYLLSCVPSEWVDGYVVSLAVRAGRSGGPVADALGRHVAARPLLLDLVLRSSCSRALQHIVLDAFARSVSALLEDVALQPSGLEPPAGRGSSYNAPLLAQVSALMGSRGDTLHDSVAAASARMLVLRSRADLPPWLWLEAVAYLTADLHAEACAPAWRPPDAQAAMLLGVISSSLRGRHDPALTGRMPLLGDDPSWVSGGRSHPPYPASSSSRSMPAAPSVARAAVSHATPEDVSLAKMFASGDLETDLLLGACRSGVLLLHDGGGDGEGEGDGDGDGDGEGDGDGGGAGGAGAPRLPRPPGRPSAPPAQGRARALARLATQLQATCRIEREGSDLEPGSASSAPGEAAARLWVRLLPHLGSLAIVPLAAMGRSEREELWDAAERLMLSSGMGRDAAPLLEYVLAAPASWLSSRAELGVCGADLLAGLLAECLGGEAQDAYGLALMLLEDFSGTVGDLLSVCEAALAPTRQAVAAQSWATEPALPAAAGALAARPTTVQPALAPPPRAAPCEAGASDAVDDAAGDASSGAAGGVLGVAGGFVAASRPAGTVSGGGRLNG